MRTRLPSIPLVILIVLLVFSPSAATAQEDAGATNTRKLAEASQNPVSSLISVPFENNTNYNAGPRNKTDNVLSIKPVYPA